MDVDDRLEALAEQDTLSVSDAMTGILRFVLLKMAKDPGAVSVREAADVLAALAKAGSGEGSLDIDDALRQMFGVEG